MVSAEELRQSIRKFNQKAEELLLQEKHDSARPYLEHVKNLQKELDDLTGGDMLRLHVPALWLCCWYPSIGRVVCGSGDRAAQSLRRYIRHQVRFMRAVLCCQVPLASASG